MRGALLLNLESALTVLLALLALREHLDRRSAAGAAAVFAGAAVLGHAPGGGSDWTGVGLIALASLSWALDNNSAVASPRVAPSP